MIIGCTKDPINYENLLYEKDGVFYGKESNKPYSGKVFSLYGDGKKKTVGNLKNGKSNGLWIWFHENGVKKYEGNWKNGKGHGLWKRYHKNGRYTLEEWEDGVRLSSKLYYKNNQLKMERIFDINGMWIEKCWDEKGKEIECK